MGAGIPQWFVDSLTYPFTIVKIFCQLYEKFFELVYGHPEPFLTVILITTSKQEE